MAGQAVLEQYISFCNSKFEKNKRALAFEKRHGIVEQFIYENLQFGFSAGNTEELIGGNKDLNQRLQNIDIVKGGKEDDARIASRFADASFDAVYCTIKQEVIRWFEADSLILDVRQTLTKNVCLKLTVATGSVLVT